MNRLLFILVLASFAGQVQAAPLGLPEVPIPADNPQTQEKIALGAYINHERRGVPMVPGKH